MASSLPIIVVTNGSGTQGQAVIKTLSQSNRYTVRALSRDPNSEKSQALAKLPNVTFFSTNNNLEEALDGAEGVIAYSANYQGEVDEIKNLGNLAVKYGVKVFIYSGGPSPSRDSNGKFQGVDHFERKFQAAEYLKTLDLKSIVIYTSFFVENFLTYNWLTYENEKFKITLNAANGDTNHPVSYISEDLGPIVVLILDNYKTTKFDSPIPLSSYKIPHKEHVDILKRITGKDVEAVFQPNFGMDDAHDIMRKYYDETGMFNNMTLPDPRLTALGHEPHDFEHFVRTKVMPNFGI